MLGKGEEISIKYGLNFSGFTRRKMESIPVNRSLVKCPKKVKVLFFFFFYLVISNEVVFFCRFYRDFEALDKELLEVQVPIE